MQHKKDKPWDNDSINHWEVTKFGKEDNPSGMLEESSFAILFPKYRGRDLLSERCRLCKAVLRQGCQHTCYIY